MSEPGTDPPLEEEEAPEGVVTPWSSVTVTFIISAIQGLVFYGFFLYQRGKEKAKNSYDLYETRQNSLSHRSPPPYDTSWWRAAWELDDEETLRCVGLDTFMFLRFLRMGARICAVGALLACVLIPTYATADERGAPTDQFNQLTLARVEKDSPRLWGALIAWYIFCFFCIKEFLDEWKLYSKLRYDFLARGDPEIPVEYRYAVRVEQIPVALRSQDALRDFFERLFPGKIRKVVMYLELNELQNMVAKRLTECVKYEKAVAFTKANPNKPAPQTTVTKGACPLTGEKRDAIDFHLKQVEKLNEDIDQERARVTKKVAAETSSVDISLNDDKQDESLKGKKSADDVISSTAMVVFTSLRAKQAAVQCQLTANIDSLVIVAAPDPRAVLWNNVTVNLPKQKIFGMQAAAVWIVTMLFWVFPMSAVASISNLASILDTVGVDDIDQNTAWYGLVSGLLPVIVLAIFMAVLYMAITGVATHFIKFKSRSEVDAYVLYWHQLFQFTNLWFLLIGGSLFNQLDTVLDDPSSLADTIAAAMPGAAAFFANMINVGSLGAFGLQLSMLPTYGVTMILNLLSPEAGRTQRMLDDAKNTPQIDWGLEIPRIVFVFLVAVIYMPIVPLMEIFALIYFAGHYVVWKHQCLHVYAVEFEGGGDATWRKLFGFLLGCLYVGEFVFIAYMGIKVRQKQLPLLGYPLHRSI